MRIARVRLVAAVLLFLAWVGWLSYQVATSADPIVVSRTQLISAAIIVITQLDADKTVTVKELLRGQGPELQPGKSISIGNLGEVHGWAGAGEYFLALYKDDKGALRVLPTPQSPGFRVDPTPSIYPVTPSTRLQVQELLAAGK